MILRETRMMNAIVFAVLLLICSAPVMAQENGAQSVLEAKFVKALSSGRFDVTTDAISDIVVISDRVAGDKFDYAYAVSNILETVDLISGENGKRTPPAFGIVYRANPKILMIGDKQTKFYDYALPLDAFLAASYWNATPAGKTDLVKKVLIKGEAPAWKSWSEEKSFSNVVVDDPNRAVAAMYFLNDNSLKDFAWALSKASMTNDKGEILKITSPYKGVIDAKGADLWKLWAKGWGTEFDYKQ